jgi:fumarylacetoacetate (FAA) hydrolase
MGVPTVPQDGGATAPSDIDAARSEPSIDNDDPGTNQASDRMKLATYRDGSRDGQLVVVSSDLSLAHYASSIASRLQQVLDDWNFVSPQLEDLARTLNQGKTRHAFPFDPRLCMAPLPRAYQWADGSAYLSHIERVRTARGTRVPENLHSEPLIVQRGSDDFRGPRDDIVVDEAHGIDFEAGVAVITGDLRIGSSSDAAIEGVRLLMLANDITLRNLVPDEATLGFSPVQSKPATSFSPVAATPDELGPAWRDGRVHLALQCHRNAKPFGWCEAGLDMKFHFGQLIAHLCKTRNVRAGSIISSGPVSNRDRSRGFSCIAEQRAVETLHRDEPLTEFLRLGDSVRIDMMGCDGASVFGAIEQCVAVAASR